jgi:hypothetical protein
MNVHKNARLTPYRRAQLVAQVEQGTPLTVVARAFGVSRQTGQMAGAPARACVPDDRAWMQDFEGGASLAQIGRSEIHRDPVDREFEPGVANGGADAVTAFADRRVGQPHRAQGRGSTTALAICLK